MDEPNSNQISAVAAVAAAVESMKSVKQQPQQTGKRSVDGLHENQAVASVPETVIDTSGEVLQAFGANKPRKSIDIQSEHSKPTVTTNASIEDAMEPGNTITGFDGAKLHSDDTASIMSQSSNEDESKIADENRKCDESDLSVSRVQGVGTVVVAPSSLSLSDGTGVLGDKTEEAGSAELNQDDNFDDWETVEVKCRGNKKKNGRSMAHQSSSLSNAGKKNKTRLKESRKIQKARKAVKDIISTLLDSVEDEVKRRRHHQARASRNTSNAVAPPVAAWKGGNLAAGLPEGTMRNGARRGGLASRQAPATQDQRYSLQVDQGRIGATVNAQFASTPGKKRPSANASAWKESKVQGTGADQQTATTIPETVSAVSDMRRTPPSDEESNIARNDSSSSDGDENRKQEGNVTPMHAGMVAVPAPPLPTLLNAENVNSASSSVASSLEAPHASHPHRHTPSSNENDVGYHLLDVCDRLTRDMHVFMARRAMALNTRRQERGALLRALQESVSVSVFFAYLFLCVCSFILPIFALVSVNLGWPFSCRAVWKLCHYVRLAVVRFGRCRVWFRSNC